MKDILNQNPTRRAYNLEKYFTDEILNDTEFVSSQDYFSLFDLYVQALKNISFIDSLNPLIRSNILIKSAGIYHKKVEKKLVDSYSVEDIDELHEIYLRALDLRENSKIKKRNFDNIENYNFFRKEFIKINNSLELYLHFFNPENLEFDSNGKVDIKFLKNSEYELLIIENKSLRSILFP